MKILRAAFLIRSIFIRKTVRRLFRRCRAREDRIYVEFRMKWLDSTDYFWVALSGNAVYDTDGQKRKLVGSIRSIQEQKEKEARQLPEEFDRRRDRFLCVQRRYGAFAGMPPDLSLRGNG